MHPAGVTHRDDGVGNVVGVKVEVVYAAIPVKDEFGFGELHRRLGKSGSGGGTSLSTAGRYTRTRFW
jgi:hypothetical protein